MATRESRLRRTAGCAVGVVLAVGAVAGCAGQEPKPSSHGGHPSEHSGHSETAGDGPEMSGMSGMDVEVTPPPGADWNADDATYLRMMIGHHRQALDMAELAATRAQSPAVRALAETIDRGQGREIVVMASWLAEHDAPVPTLEEAEEMAAGHHGGMAGMLDADQLAALADADGPAFDRLFLAGMIQHHQGAISMAQTEVAVGMDPRVIEMAGDVIGSQSGEIARMRVVQRQLG